MEKDRLLKLVEAYQEHFKQYNRPDYNETEVRNDFVNPFFEILGWDVQNKKNLPQHLREVKHEASVFVEENGKQVKKKPDYEFHVGSTPYFFLETKKPNVDIMTSTEFIATEPTMQDILTSKYPILLIDESQDTKKELIDALLIVCEKYGEKFIVGMFGDTMQKIYNDGKDNLAKCIPDNWVSGGTFDETLE